MIACLEFAGRPRLWLVLAISMTCFFNSNQLIAVQDEDPPAAVNLAQTALRMQNSNDYETAAETWESLLNQFPKTSLTGKARYNAGVCYVQLGQFKKAIAQLESALTSLDKKEEAKLANAHLFLGFSQARFGQSIVQQQSEEGKQWLTRSTKTLATLLDKYPNFEDADQACFFQGGSFEQLGMLNEAAESYLKMQKFKKQSFRFDGLFALANVYEQLGQFDKAIKHYNDFRKLAATEGGNENLTEVNFRAAETLVQMATADTTKNDTSAANTKYSEAEKLYEAAAADQDFELRDLAMFQQAFCVNRTGDLPRAAKLYESVANIPDSKYRARALTYAGRDYLNSENGDKAQDILVEAVKSDSPYAVEAAHWLAQLYLRATGNAQFAFDVADLWIEKSKDHPFHVNLMLDRADAAYAIDSRRKDSPALFLEITDNHPEHRLADTALYNAAFAELELGNFKEAIKLAARFENKYAGSDYLTDTLEVKADASLLDGQNKSAQSIFQLLVDQNPTSEKSNNWKLRIGLAAYLQKDYDTALSTLSPLITDEGFTDSKLKAEALHWAGSAHMQKEKWKDAIVLLMLSYDTDPNWTRADETLFNMAHANSSAGFHKEAIKLTNQLIQEFPKSPLIAQARYRAGEAAYQSSDYESAIENYQSVVNDYPKSEFVPFAIYGTAWSHVKQKEFKQSVEQFTNLIDRYPDHELTHRARVGRGASLRQSGEPEKAIADISTFLDSNPQGQTQKDALYELGLAQVDSKEWKDAISTFTQLVESDGQSPLADRFHYELAWALQSDGQAKPALTTFETIAAQFPKSPLAAEANFHVGNNAYEEEDYDQAIENFQKCLDSDTTDTLREKAAYKLAWSHYKLKDYAKSHAAFKNQIDQFASGTLAADGHFMVAVSLFRVDEYEKAFDAYVAAQPLVEKSKDIESKIPVLTRLHGAQSANKIKKFQEALDLALPVTQSNAEQSFKDDAFYQTGEAHRGLGNPEKAIEAWKVAALNTGKTGARARCMIGDVLFEQKKFDDAIKQYKLVFYGYGGTQSADDIKPLQAYAVYECGLCSYVRIKDATPEARPGFIKHATEMFNYLLENYPDDKLVKQTKDNLETLKKLATAN